MPTVGPVEILMILAWAALVIVIPIVVIAAGLRLAGIGRRDPHRRLRERLARGEITQSEFETATRALGG